MHARRTVFWLVLACASSSLSASDDDSAVQIEQLIRWARIDGDQLPVPDRYRRYDEAIALTQSDADALASDPERELAWAVWVRLCNRVVAFQERQRPADAVALHALLGRVPGRTRPAYVQAAAGSAWADLREPERAIPLFEEALSGYEPGSSDWSGIASQLLWALADAGRGLEAADRVDHWIATTPRRAPAWLDLRLHRIQTSLALDRVEAAQSEAKELQGEAPFNASVREALASVARARGWPRLALEETRLAASAANPAALGSSADESELLLDLGRTAEAYQTLERARRREPDAGSVRRATARWSLLQRPELPLETFYARSSDNSPFGSQEWRVVGWGFTPPIQRDFRLFARVFETGATFPDQTVNWLRGAIGGEWTPADWRLRADFAAGADARPGGTLSARFSPSDHWEFGAHLGTATDAVPLQAWRAGILLDVDAGAEAAYAWSEASRVALSAGWLVFGDGNLRRSLLGSVKERLGVAGAFRFDGALWLSASDNSAASAAYFNPSGSASASAEVTTVFRTWERLDRSFEQRLTLSLGGAWQADFGTKPAFSGRYDHAWRLGPAFQLDYGVSYSSNPYDGVQTRALGIHLGLDWRI